MPSLIPGFEYDIFISYRQKDNKHDGWVTTFVEELKGELEATFKEDISIYFDENPSDGLLETHSVDKSLEGKLRCLIFIPIISRTYCDPKSYAWQNEFCAFNKLAKENKFGRDIRLAAGMMRVEYSLISYAHSSILRFFWQKIEVTLSVASWIKILELLSAS